MIKERYVSASIAINVVGNTKRGTGFESLHLINADRTDMFNVGQRNADRRKYCPRLNLTLGIQIPSS